MLSGPPVSWMVPPAQTGVLAEAVAVGLGLTTTEAVFAGSDVQPPLVTVKVYTPAIAEVALDIEGDCRLEVKLLGPVQL